MGVVGQRRVALVDGAQRDRARCPAPLSPPPPLPRAGRRCSMSMTIPRTVLTSTRAVAPASTAARATSTSSGVLGESFTHSGKPRRRGSVDDLRGHVAASARRSRRGPRGWGTTRSPRGPPRSAPRIARAACGELCRRYVPRSNRPRVRRDATAPGGSRDATPRRRVRPRPTALTMSLPTTATRGAGLPAHSKAASDLVTTAPEFGEVAVAREFVAVTRRCPRR